MDICQTHVVLTVTTTFKIIFSSIHAYYNVQVASHPGGYHSCRPTTVPAALQTDIHPTRRSSVNYYSLSVPME